MDVAVSRESGQKQHFEFSGSGGEYFRIWIVNLALTILTLGIFSAWAKVRRLRYFYGHTALDGHNFDYLADPKRILVGRIIAVLLLLLYSQTPTFFPAATLYVLILLLLMLPFIIVTSSAFSFRNTAYRNIRFHFRSEVRAAYASVMPPLVILLVLVGVLNVLLPEELGTAEDGTIMTKAMALPQFTLLLALPFIPWLDHIRASFVINRVQYGKTRGSFHAGVGAFYKLYLLTVLGFCAVLLILGGLVFVLIPLLTVAATGSGFGVAGIFIIAALIYGLMFVVFSWFLSARNNLLRNNTRMGDNRLAGDFKGWELCWILFSNAVAIICTLGMFTPWAGIRLARYNAAHTHMEVANLEETVAQAADEENAIGEEIGEFFDIDIGI